MESKYIGDKSLLGMWGDIIIGYDEIFITEKSVYILLGAKKIYLFNTEHIPNKIDFDKAIKIVKEKYLDLQIILYSIRDEQEYVLNKYIKLLEEL